MGKLLEFIHHMAGQIAAPRAVETIEVLVWFPPKFNISKAGREYLEIPGENLTKKEPVRVLYFGDNHREVEQSVKVGDKIKIIGTPKDGNTFMGHRLHKEGAKLESQESRLRAEMYREYGGEAEYQRRQREQRALNRANGLVPVFEPTTFGNLARLTWCKIHDTVFVAGAYVRKVDYLMERLGASVVNEEARRLVRGALPEPQLQKAGDFYRPKPAAWMSAFREWVDASLERVMGKLPEAHKYPLPKTSKQEAEAVFG